MAFPSRPQSFLSPGSATLPRSDNSRSVDLNSAQPNSGSRFSFHSLSPRNLFKRGTKIAQSPAKKHVSRSSSLEGLPASPFENPLHGIPASNVGTRRSVSWFGSLPSRRTSTRQSRDINASLQACQPLPTLNLLENQINQNASLTTHGPPSASCTSEHQTSPRTVNLPAFPKDGRMLLPNKVHSLNSLTTSATESFIIRTPKAARSSQSSIANYSSSERFNVAAPRASVADSSLHARGFSERDTWSTAGSGSVLANPDKRATVHDELSTDKHRRRPLSQASTKHAKRQSMPLFLPSLKPTQPSGDKSNSNSVCQGDNTRSVRRRSLVSVDFQSAGLRSKSPCIDTLNASLPRFSVEHTASYRSSPVTEIASDARLPFGASITEFDHLESRASQRAEIDRTSIGVRTSSRLLHDAIKERIDALTGEARALMQLLASMSNDFVIQEQMDDGELVEDIRAFFDDEQFKAFERCM